MKYAKEEIEVEIAKAFGTKTNWKFSIIQDKIDRTSIDGLRKFKYCGDDCEIIERKLKTYIPSFMQKGLLKASRRVDKKCLKKFTLNKDFGVNLGADIIITFTDYEILISEVIEKWLTKFNLPILWEVLETLPFMQTEEKFVDSLAREYFEDTGFEINKITSSAVLEMWLDSKEEDYQSRIIQTLYSK
jgi:hypothetical protein